MQSRMTVLRREGRSLESRIEKALADLRKAPPRLLGVVLITASTGVSSRHRDRAFVYIHPYVRGTFFHGRLLRMRLCRPDGNPRLGSHPCVKPRLRMESVVP